MKKIILYLCLVLFVTHGVATALTRAEIEQKRTARSVDKMAKTVERGIQQWSKNNLERLKNINQLKNINEVLLYCNTQDFVRNMIANDYRMQLAASGLVHGEKHQHLASMEMWLNPQNSQWAIVFVYKNMDKSCILGGNDVGLHTPDFP